MPATKGAKSSAFDGPGGIEDASNPENKHSECSASTSTDYACRIGPFPFLRKGQGLTPKYGRLSRQRLQGNMTDSAAAKRDVAAAMPETSDDSGCRELASASSSGGRAAALLVDPQQQRMQQKSDADVSLSESTRHFEQLEREADSSQFSCASPFVTHSSHLLQHQQNAPKLTVQRIPNFASDLFDLSTSVSCFHCVLQKRRPIVVELIDEEAGSSRAAAGVSNKNLNRNAADDDLQRTCECSLGLIPFGELLQSRMTPILPKKETQLQRSHSNVISFSQSHNLSSLRSSS